MAIEYLLLIASLLILISITIAKLSDNLGVPALLLFLGIGLLMGSEGIGGIEFTDPGLATSIGIVALVFILFAGGLDTNWAFVRPVLWHAMSLSTVGVFLTAMLVGVFAAHVIGLNLLEGLLLGAVISSTDAAAVFSVLRSKNVSLRGNLKPLLELESGSNDPMAVFLTLAVIQLIQSPDQGFWGMIVYFFMQMGIGGVFGFAGGRGMTILINRFKFSYEGFYPVFAIAAAAFVYSFTSVVGGSGFLAVYIAGIIMGNSDIVQKRSLMRFFDGLAWLGQIGMFLALGLLAFPSRILPVMGVGLLISAFLMFIARPASVFVALGFTRLPVRAKLFISWVGLRGAVPIILATFPLLARLPNADLIFNVVFFIVLTSALLQGSSITAFARLLKVDAPLERTRKSPLEFVPSESIDSELVDFIVPYNCEVVGKSIVELGLPKDSLIVLITRNEDFIVPSGSTVLEAGDTILALVNKRSLPEVREVFSKQREEN